jgi:cellobiose-specific phosphotransferase system component IIC
MSHKISGCIIAAIVISLIAPFYCFGQHEGSSSLNITGKIVSPLSKTNIRILYSAPDNPRAVYSFFITTRTRIDGTLKVGSVVTITFKRRRRVHRASQRVALAIKVLNTAP